MDALCLQEALEQTGGAQYSISRVETLADGKNHLAKDNVDVLVLDLGLPDSQGMDTFLEVKQSTLDVAIVVLSGLDDEDLAVEAVRKGAQDYLCKDHWNANLISRSLAYAIERRRILNELRESEERFRAIFEGSDDAIWIQDKNLKVTHMNPTMEHILDPCTRSCLE